MSHTNRGGKSPGFEYWTARPFNRVGTGPGTNGGRFAKKRTHKAERQQGRTQARNQEA